MNIMLIFRVGKTVGVPWPKFREHAKEKYDLVPLRSKLLPFLDPWRKPPHNPWI